MLAVLLALGRYSNNNSRVGQVLTCRSEMLSRICELRVRTQPYKPAVDHADHTAPTRQRELQIVQITQIIQIMQIIRIHTSAIKHLDHQAGTNYQSEVCVSEQLLHKCYRNKKRDSCRCR